MKHLATSERSRRVLARGRSRQMVLKGRRLRSILPRSFPPDLRGRRSGRSQRVGADPRRSPRRHPSARPVSPEHVPGRSRATYKTDPVGAPCSRSCHRARLRPGRSTRSSAPFSTFRSCIPRTLRHQEARFGSTKTLGDPESGKFARHHHDIVARFGRFPHRNAILGRESTPEETPFWQQSDFRG